MGRFLSADPVQPCPEDSHPGTQGYNSYAYVANNPTTWVDPSGYSSALPTNLTPAQTAILVSLMASLPALLLVPGGIGVPFLILGLTIHCALVQGCLPRLKEMNKFIDTLGSSGINTVEWTIETLNTAFAKYPLLPEAPPAMQLMAGLGLGLLGLDTVTDFATLISGRDPITGHALTPQEMFVTWLAFSIPLVSAGFLRGFADDAVEMADDLPLLSGETCSFSAETPVTTAEGETAISDVAVGDQVLAWNEELGQSDYYTVTAVWAHTDPVTVHLVINGEAVETTPDHPFLRTDGQWIPAGELELGNVIRRADGKSGTVEAIKLAATPQVMYNMTVADAHTYTVGDGEWVVHNSCWTSNVRRGLSPVENAFEHWKKHRADFPNMNNALEYLNETRKFLSDPPSAALILTRSNGDLVVYDPVSQIFAIAMGDGTPRTMYIPDPVVHGYLTNLDYFFAQAK